MSCAKCIDSVSVAQGTMHKRPEPRKKIPSFILEFLTRHTVEDLAKFSRVEFKSDGLCVLKVKCLELDTKQPVLGQGNNFNYTPVNVGRTLRKHSLPKLAECRIYRSMSQ